mgnify:CR=1 FL=1
MLDIISITTFSYLNFLNNNTYQYNAILHPIFLHHNYLRRSFLLSFSFFIFTLFFTGRNSNPSGNFGFSFVWAKIICSSQLLVSNHTNLRTLSFFIKRVIISRVLRTFFFNFPCFSIFS